MKRNNLFFWGGSQVRLRQTGSQKIHREVKDIIVFRRVCRRAKEKLMCETLHDMKYKGSMSSEQRRMEVVSRAFVQDQGLDLGFEMRIRISERRVKSF